MLEEPVNDREIQLKSLVKTVAKAAEFFATVDDTLFDGYQTAREVLAHLVFWHREYVTIIQALNAGHKPQLRQGTFAELNAAAACESKQISMAHMSRQLVILQDSLETLLLDLPDWSITFPIKQGSRHRSVSQRVPAIESHITGHLKRMQRVKRLGADWVQAYYPDQANEGGSS